MNDNCNPVIHHTKRQLSRYEKRFLPTYDHRAFLMPGHPPRRNTHVSEIDELLEAGYEGMQIVGIENDPNIAEELYDHYRDSVQIHLGEARDHLLTSSSYFSYMHFDFCQQFSNEQVATIAAWQGRLATIAHIRVSLSTTRRQSQQLEYERALRHNILVPFLISAANLEEQYSHPHPERWEALLPLLNNDDSTQLVGILMLFNHVFGITFEQYIDLCGLDAPVFPAMRGQHFLANVQRFSYREATGHTSMSTIWADCFPLHSHTIPDQRWALNLVYNFCLSLTGELYPFTPAIFMED